MYSSNSVGAGFAVPLSAIVSTSLAAPAGFPEAFWGAYVIAHLIVAVMSLVGVAMAMQKLIAMRADRDWARSPRAHRLDLDLCADPV